ncbi:MAG: fimbrial biogenesis outer membrane usher protein [Myxococcales bacterium]
MIGRGRHAPLVLASILITSAAGAELSAGPAVADPDLSAGAVAGAEPSPGTGVAPAGPADQPALLDLFVNGVAKQVVFSLVRPDDVLVDRRDLLAAGIPAEDEPVQRVGGRTLVSLRGLSTKLGYTVDDRDLSLHLTLAPRYLGRALFDLSPSPRPPNIDLRSDTSVFFNYAVQGRSGLGVSGFLETGASHRNWLLGSSGSRLTNGSFVRGLTSAAYDDVPNLRRFTLGDDVVNGLGPLGGSVLLGGFSVGREFSLDPYLLHAPLPHAQGFALTPSTLDVYVDGQLVRQQAVAPGSFELANLPASTGAGVIRTVLRDAFGRTQDLSTRYYFSSGLLSRGTSDYAVQLGARRNAFGTDSFGYGPAVLLARDRVGLTDEITVGGRLEALGGDVFSGGPSATLALPAGELELSAALSRDGNAPGGGASAGYRFTSRMVSAGALVRMQSPRYATASLRAATDRPTFFTDAFASVPLGRRLSATLEYVAQRSRDLGFNDRLSARGDLQLGRGVSLSMSADRARPPGAAAELGFLVMLSWAYGERSTADAYGSRHGRTTGAGAGAQQGLPAGEGAGYRVRTERGELGDSALAQVQYQGPYGRYEAGVERLFGSTVASASVAGGLVAVGGNLFLSRSVDQGFAVVDTGGVEGVRGYSNNQPIGRTDGRGLLLIPSLLPYYGNRIAIQGTDVPIEYAIGSTEQLVAPSLRGGALVRFALKRVRTVTGRVLMARPGGPPAPPAFGTLQVPGQTGSLPSPIGAGGEFYLEDLPAGNHPAEVRSETGACAVELRIPADGPAMLDLGELRCSAVTLPTAAAAGSGSADGLNDRGTSASSSP